MPRVCFLAGGSLRPAATRASSSVQIPIWPCKQADTDVRFNFLRPLGDGKARARVVCSFKSLDFRAVHTAVRYSTEP